MTQGDGEQRRELLERIEASAASSAPLLTAANYHPTCGPSAWDESMRFCVLLMVGRPEGTPWSAEQKRLLNLFREVHADNPRFSVRFAWVDAARQQPFADALLGRKKSASDEPRRCTRRWWRCGRTTGRSTASRGCGDCGTRGSGCPRWRRSRAPR